MALFIPLPLRLQLARLPVQQFFALIQN